MNTQPALPTRAEWQAMIAPYQHADLRRGLGQLANTLLPYLGLWALMIASLQVSTWLALALALLASGFLVRLFIIFHDCGHGSFFASKSANRWVGFCLGVLTFTPSEHWWREHAIHHATVGNLDKRGVGDVETMTVAEYRSSPWWKRLPYQIFRHPLGMFGAGPIAMFLIRQRFASSVAGRRERLNVALTNLAILAVGVGMSVMIGWQAYLGLQLLVLWLAGMGGIWLFYLQHQFENTYWVRSGEWDFTRAALLGSSCYRLPRVLQWFSGSIGFHHIHHLSPRIPNYFLEACQRANPTLQPATTLTLRSGLKSLGLRVWDEQAGRLVKF